MKMRIEFPKMAAPSSHAQTTPQPPYCRLKVIINRVLREKLQNAKSCLSHLLESQQMHEMLIAESRLLHVVIYKRSNQLRIEKSKQLLRRVKACLQRLHIVGRIFPLAENVNMDISSLQEDETFLPSQQVWTFLLLLASNYFELLTRTMEYCTKSFEHLGCHFASGMLIPTMVLCMGTVARIWQLCRGLQARFAPFYSLVCSVQCDMKPSKSDWVYPSLPKELSNPVTPVANQLEEWSSSLKSLPETMTDSVIDKEQSASVSRLSDNTHKAIVTVPKWPLLDESEDLGEAVNSKEQNLKRPRDRGLTSKVKYKEAQSQKSAQILLQERPMNETGEFDPELKITQKKKKKKKTIKEENVSLTEHDFDTSHTDINPDDHKKLLKKKLKEKKKKKKLKELALQQILDEHQGNVSNEKVMRKQKKKDAKQKSKLKKKQVNIDLNVAKQKVNKTDWKQRNKSVTAKNLKNAEKKNKKRKDKATATHFDFNHNKRKKRKKT